MKNRKILVLAILTLLVSLVGTNNSRASTITLGNFHKISGCINAAATGGSKISNDGLNISYLVNNGSICISHDGGISWKLLTVPGTQNQISREFTMSEDGTRIAIAFAATSNGPWGGYIYTSSDSGETWTTQATAGNRAWWSISGSSDGLNLIDCALSSNPGLMIKDEYVYVSHDGGTSWVRQNITSVWMSTFSNSSGSRLAAMAWTTGPTNSNLVYESLDNGATWQAISNPPTMALGYSITASEDLSNIAVGNANGGGIYLFNGNWIYVNTVPVLSSGQGWISYGTSSNALYTVADFSSTQALIMTSNFGSSWQTLLDDGITSVKYPSVSRNGIFTFVSSSTGENYINGYPLLTLQPSFGNATSTLNGFTLQIINYDSNFTWAGTDSANGLVSIDDTGLVTVTGLAPGIPSTVTVSASRAGYAEGVATSVSISSLKATQAALSVSNSSLSNPASTSITLTSNGGAGSGMTIFSVTGNGCLLSGTGNTILSSSQAGDCIVTASNPGDSTYLPATSTPVTFTFTPVVQSPAVTVTNTTLTAQNGSMVPLNASGGNGNGAYSFSTQSSGCTISNSSLTRAAAGTCVVTATRAASGIYAAATSAPVTFTFAAPANQAKLTISNTSKSATATSTLGLTTSGGTGAGLVSFTIAGGTAGASGSNCVVNGSSLSTTQSGTCIVIATKASNGIYNPTSSAAVTFTFTAVAQTAVTLTPSATSGISGTPIGLAVSGGSGAGAFTFASATTGCTARTTDAVLGTGTISRSASTGSCSVTVSRSANGIYSAITSPAVSIAFSAAPQSSVILTPTSLTSAAGTAITLNASGGTGSGLYSFATSTSGCTVATSNSSTGVGTINRSSATGTCSVTATKAANGIYSSATSTAVTVSFSSATQSALLISNSNAANVAKGSTGITLVSTGGTGTGAVSYSVTGTGCTLSGSKLTVATTYLPGSSVSCSVVATKAASGIYAAKSSIAMVFNFL